MVRRVVEEERISRPDVYVDDTSGPALGMGILVGILLVGVAVLAVLFATGTFNGTNHNNSPAPTVSNGVGGNQAPQVSQAPQAPASAIGSP